MRSPEQIAQTIPLPAGMERRHLAEGARLTLADGLIARDGTVLDRARQLAAAETPEAREIWAQVMDLLGRSGLPESTMVHWLGGIHPSADGDRLVLMAPRSRAEWVARRYGRLIREAIERLDTEARWSGMVVRPYGPESQSHPRPAPTHREQRRAAA